ncbi:MAG TPA: hypothetical protein PLU30_23525 [Verrucomicrobiae bacterium]|nr:hypothetical protein [Verrucomicrobiae bacterium]
MQPHQAIGLLQRVHEDLRSRPAPHLPGDLSPDQAGANEQDHRPAIDSLVRRWILSGQPVFPALDPWEMHFVAFRIEYGMLVLGALHGLGMPLPEKASTRNRMLEALLLGAWSRTGADWYHFQQVRVATLIRQVLAGPPRSGESRTDA